MVIWIVGLSGAGKTTIGKEVYSQIKNKYLNTVFLDGDEIRKVLQNDKEPSQLVKELGLEQVSDNDELEKIVDDALKDEEDNIMKFQSGSDRVLGYFVGKCLKATKGKGNPKVINELLLKKLNK